MALTINTYHGTRNRSNRSGGLASIANFVEHYTGGTGSAKANCIFFATGNRRSSADLFVDKDGTVWEYNNILDGYNTWHVGDGHGEYGITNTNSIGIEVVSNGEDFTEAQIASLVALYSHACSVLGRKLNVVRHYDASRKQCPAPYVDQAKWEALKARTEGGRAQAVPSVPSAPASPAAPTVTSPAAVDFQKWLNRTYGYRLALDDRFGPDCRKHAVMALQTEYNRQFGEKLAVDGSPGPKTKAAWSRHNIRRGAKGNITCVIQMLLYSKGYDPKGFDGSFGAGCEAAVKRFQADNSLAKDGIVGKNSLVKLTA